MSFSAEMKDFLNAYKTGQSINASRTDQDYKEVKTEAEKQKTLRDNDPDTLATAAEQAKATLAATKQRMGLAASARGDASANSALSRQYTQERINQLRLANQPGGSGLAIPGAINPAVGGAAAQPVPAAQGVLPVGPSTVDDQSDLYAEGGLVPDDEEELPDEATQQQGVLDTSAQPAAPLNPPTDVSARRRDPNQVPKGLEGVISPALVEDARKAGLMFGVNKAGLGQGAMRTPAQQLKAKQIAQGMGGLTPEEMQAAAQAVDPDGKMPEGLRNVAALGSVYQFWANKGEPEKAQRVAFQMLQYYRNTSQRYAAIAAKAAEGGNMDLATRAALKAYANVPDGKDLEVTPNPDGGLMYTYTNEKGDVIAKGIATPQQLVSSAMGLAQGGFDKALMSAAGAATDPNAGAVKTSGKAQSSSDRAKEGESIGTEIDKMKTAWQGKNKDKPVDEEQWTQIGDAARHIYQQNKNATESEAVRAAHAMLSMGDDPEKPGFKVKPGEEGKPNVVDFGGKLKVELDDNQLESILNARAARVKSAVDDIDKKNTEGEKPGFVDKASGAIGDAGGIIANDAKKFAGEVRGAIPDELAARGGSAVQSVGRAVNDVLQSLTSGDNATGGTAATYKKAATDVARALMDKLPAALSNKGAIPVDEGDRPL